MNKKSVAYKEIIDAIKGKSTKIVYIGSGNTEKCLSVLFFVLIFADTILLIELLLFFALILLIS